MTQAAHSKQPEHLALHSLFQHPSGVYDLQHRCLGLYASATLWLTENPVILHNSFRVVPWTLYYKSTSHAQEK